MQRPKRAHNGDNWLPKDWNDSPNKKREKSYLKQKICHICKNVFDAEDGKNYQKVRDQSYYTGKCSGAAQRICNLKIQNTKTNSCSNT